MSDKLRKEERRLSLSNHFDNFYADLRDIYGFEQCEIHASLGLFFSDAIFADGDIADWIIRYKAFQKMCDEKLNAKCQNID